MTVNAAKIVAVLEVTLSQDDLKVSISELRHLTDELRTKARSSLSKDYVILTRDNILQLLPPDETERDCLAEGCAVDVGRAIGAEYVTQASVGRFGEMFTLTVELYESMSGNLLGSFVTESKNVMGLLNAIRENSPELFVNVNQSDVKVEKPQTLISPVSKKSSYTWLAVTLDVIGAAVLGFGIYKHVEGNKLYSDYKKEFNRDQNSPPRELSELQELERQQKAALNKANDARKIGNISVVAGGFFIASGVVVHVWF